MVGSMRSKIVAAALSELTFSERMRIRFEQTYNLFQGLVANSAFLLFFGMQLILFGVLAYRTDPFSDALVWNVLACVVLGAMALADFDSRVAHSSGAFPYLPIDDRRLRIMGIWRNVAAAIWPAVYSLWAVAAALTQSGLSWYVIIYIAVITVLSQCVISLLLAESPIARVIGRLRDFSGFGNLSMLFMIFPVAAIGILFLPERNWPRIEQISLFAWVWPPTWPTLVLAQAANWGFAMVGVALTALAILCCCVLVLVLKRSLEQHELLEFSFNSFYTDAQGDNAATDMQAAALILPKEVLDYWRVAPSFVPEVDKTRLDLDDYLDRCFAVERDKRESLPALSVLPEANQPETLFRTLLNIVLTQEDLRFLEISRSSSLWSSELLNVHVRAWLPRVLLLMVAAVFIPASWLVLFGFPACIFATNGIWKHILFDELKHMHLLPIDARAIIRAESKYRLTCVVPMVIAGILIGSICAVRQGATWDLVLMFILKAILAGVVSMPAMVAVGFVSTLNSSWFSFRSARFGTALMFYILLGVAGIGAFCFPFYGLELLGILPATIASRCIYELCIDWYETAPTDVALTS